ncbi:hypothetical protein PMSD_09715 [Paenibacillus macquariensis subsp. defensor]|uniref:Uncharacterized protein n=1 Tax=Paenibacillus macquariensis TaxID=948756 RepID=A0ABY1K7N3_9BACL|nr:hypothetical protein [Paenibacillus macquariensis]MEC0091123.1 hypothetical protein [Paenibacillus macquariensis]OAB33693.1 hypothetical protein PMSM_13785 [Paenibacillus macquariensis subsp. macquariensis]OAB37071.1 hypothetical protein PMSD_09715 [Paenibacillus macquariensis subsp. defensor]SIR37817.1 hypothetical protein SAMN05421578_11273 [Paenibacillus macquariensis]
MRSTDYFNRTVEVLRRLETYGYQVAYYILQDEDLAMDATKIVLLALAQEDTLYNLPVSVQRDLMKRKIMKQSMLLKYEVLSA